MAEENEPIYVNGDSDTDSLVWFVILSFLSYTIPCPRPYFINVEGFYGAISVADTLFGFSSICMENNRPAMYGLILAELEKLNLPCRTCHP